MTVFVLVLVETNILPISLCESFLKFLKGKFICIISHIFCAGIDVSTSLYKLLCMRLIRGMFITTQLIYFSHYSELD